MMHFQTLFLGRYARWHRTWITNPIPEGTSDDPDQPHLDLYDTSGPRDVNPHTWWITQNSQEWVDAREGKHDRYTQIHFTRKGMITEEMQFVAAREGVDAEFVREEVARGTFLRCYHVLLFV